MWRDELEYPQRADASCRRTGGEVDADMLDIGGAGGMSEQTRVDALETAAQRVLPRICRISNRDSVRNGAQAEYLETQQHWTYRPPLPKRE